MQHPQSKDIIINIISTDKNGIHQNNDNTLVDSKREDASSPQPVVMTAMTKCYPVDSRLSLEALLSKPDDPSDNYFNLLTTFTTKDIDMGNPSASSATTTKSAAIPPPSILDEGDGTDDSKSSSYIDVGGDDSKSATSTGRTPSITFSTAHSANNILPADKIILQQHSVQYPPPLVPAQRQLQEHEREQQPHQKRQSPMVANNADEDEDEDDEDDDDRIPSDIEQRTADAASALFALIGAPEAATPSLHSSPLSTLIIRNHHHQHHQQQQQQTRRHRKKFDQVERLFKCNYGTCQKSYGTLNHLNHHIVLQSHGPKRKTSEFTAERQYLKDKQRRQSISSSERG